MAALPLTDLRRQLTDVANRASFKRERTIVKRNGKPAFAIVPIEDIRTLLEYEARENALDNALADKALAEGDFMDLEDFWAELDKDGL